MRSQLLLGIVLGLWTHTHMIRRFCESSWHYTEEKISMIQVGSVEFHLRRDRVTVAWCMPITHLLPISVFVEVSSGFLWLNSSCIWSGVEINNSVWCRQDHHKLTSSLLRRLWITAIQNLVVLYIISSICKVMGSFVNKGSSARIVRS